MAKEQATTIGREKVHMDLRFLGYLASTGATNIHPLGRSASKALITQLDVRPGQRVFEVGVRDGRHDGARGSEVPRHESMALTHYPRCYAWRGGGSASRASVSAPACNR